MRTSRGGDFAGPGIMLLSALLFGYFGFMTTFNATGVNGKFLLFVSMLEWTLKISAVAFLVCALIAFVLPLIGNLIYSIVGIVGAVMFVIIAIMDIMDPQHQALHPFILLVFAAFNGYGSLQGLRSVMWMVRGRRDESATPQVM